MWSNLQQCAEKSKRLLQVIKKQIFQSFSNFRESGKIIPSNIQAMSMSTQIIQSVFLFLNSKIKDFLGLTQLTQALSACFSLLNLVCQISVKVLLNYTAENVMEMSFFRPRSKLIKELFDIVEQSKEQPCLKQLSIQERDNLIKRRLNESESQTVAKLQQIFSIFKCSALSAMHVEEMLSNSSFFVKELMKQCLPAQPFVDRTLSSFVQAFRGQLLAIFQKQVKRESERIFANYLNSILERCNQCESQTQLTSQSINSLQKTIRERQSTIFKLKDQRQCLLAKIEQEIHQRRELEQELKTTNETLKKSTEESRQKIQSQQKYERFLNSQIFKNKEEASKIHRELAQARLDLQAKNSSLLQLREDYSTLSQDYSKLAKSKKENRIDPLPEINISPNLAQPDHSKSVKRVQIQFKRLNYSQLLEISVHKSTANPVNPANPSFQKIQSKTEFKNFQSISQLPDQVDLPQPDMKRISSLVIKKKVSMDNYVNQFSPTPSSKPCSNSIIAVKNHLQQLVESNFKTRNRSFKQIVNQKKNEFSLLFQQKGPQRCELIKNDQKKDLKKSKKAYDIQQFVIRNSIKSKISQFIFQLEQASQKDPSVLAKLGLLLKKQIKSIQTAKFVMESFMLNHQKCGKFCKHLHELKIDLGFNTKVIEFNQGGLGPWKVNY